MSIRFLAGMLWVALAGATTVCGQDYPNKPIRIIAGGVGSNGDFSSRVIAQGIAGPMGQSVVIDNRASAITGEIVAKAPPDGYTLLSTGSSLWSEPLLHKMPYDPVKDFLPITLVLRVPNVIVVHPSLPVKSVRELIALAKARPGELNYGTSSGVSGSYIAGEAFKAMARINIARVPYKDDNLRIVDLVAGRVDLTFAGPPIVMPHVNSGKLRALAVTSLEPSALLPGLPTAAGSGLPGYESASFSGMFAPAKTPDAIITRLNREIVRVLSTAEAKKRFLDVGAEAVGNSPEEFAATIKSEMATLIRVIKDAGIKVE